MSNDVLDSSRLAEQEGFVDCAGVRLHYTARGRGPLMLLLHGFPDDSRTWRAIAPSLASRCRVVTPDLRGYTLSDKPEGVHNNRLPHLVNDVLCLIDRFGEKRAILVGHDWGGVIAQAVAMQHPASVSRLVLIAMPHLNGLLRELAINRRQQAASWYARLFQTGLLEGPFDASILLRQLRNGRGLRETTDVLRRSNVTGLLDYYRANFPQPPYHLKRNTFSNVKAPTLMIAGAQDPYVLVDCFNSNDQWFDAGVETRIVEHAGHWVHHDARQLVIDALLRE